MKGHNYELAIQELIEKGRISNDPGTLQNLDIQHDDWCGIYRNQHCNCHPDIYLDKKLLVSNYGASKQRLTYEDIFLQILHEVTGKPKDAIRRFPGLMQEMAKSNRLDMQVSQQEYEQLLSDLRKEKSGILNWLIKGKYLTGIYSQHRARLNPRATREFWLENFIRTWQSAVGSKNRVSEAGSDLELLDMFALHLGYELDSPAALRVMPHKQALRLLWWMNDLEKSQIVVFSGEQAKVFVDSSKSPFSPDDYRLPFHSVFLWFSEPIEYVNPDFAETVSIESMLLTRHTFGDDPNTLDESSTIYDRVIVFEEYPSLWGLNVWETKGGVSRYVELGGTSKKKRSEKEPEVIHKLVTACIGYINCENVYLHKEGIVDEAVNRKRERKGKARLEPYYVCRIRGVNYDSHATGTGTAHGHRYDVRGHFRRLDSGKVTWVRPHQRGLANELYIPKVYKVDKRQENA